MNRSPRRRLWWEESITNMNKLWMSIRKNVSETNTMCAQSSLHGKMYLFSNLYLVNIVAPHKHVAITPVSCSRESSNSGGIKLKQQRNGTF